MPFRDVQGHRRVLALLARSIAHDTLPPSLIFAGSDEASARQAAVAVAQALNCTNAQAAASAPQHPASVAEPPGSVPQPPVWDACGTCASCVRISRGVHPDVFVVEPGDTGAIKIDQVRDVIDRAAYRPFEGRRRVVIVAGADALVPAAQNALLKTLEEPAPSSVFILITARPDALLATVRSRCIRLTFQASLAAPDDDDAATIAERVLAEAAATTDPRRRMEAAKAMLSGAGGAAEREQLASELRAMAVLLRDIEAVSTGADPAVLARPGNTVVRRLADAFGGERAVRAFAAVDRALAALERNASAKIVADWLVLEL